MTAAIECNETPRPRPARPSHNPPPAPATRTPPAANTADPPPTRATKSPPAASERRTANRWPSRPSPPETANRAASGTNAHPCARCATVRPDAAAGDGTVVIARNPSSEHPNANPTKPKYIGRHRSKRALGCVSMRQPPFDLESQDVNAQARYREQTRTQQPTERREPILPSRPLDPVLERYKRTNRTA